MGGKRELFNVIHLQSKIFSEDLTNYLLSSVEWGQEKDPRDRQIFGYTIWYIL